MRQTTPWGSPSTNPGAFGVGADDSTFGERLRMPGVSQDQVRLGTDPTDLVDDAGAALETGKTDPSYASIGKSVALASLGGALVGYLATGGRGWRGAALGASVNATLVYAGTAIAGRKAYSNGMLALRAVLGLAAAGSAGYLYMGQRRGR